MFRGADLIDGAPSPQATASPDLAGGGRGGTFLLLQSSLSFFFPGGQERAPSEVGQVPPTQLRRSWTAVVRTMKQEHPAGSATLTHTRMHQVNY